MLKSRTIFSQRCIKCSKEYDILSHINACECGGIVDFEYDLNLESWEWVDRKSPGIMRYSRLLPILDPSNGILIESIYSNPTSLYRSDELGKFLGLRNLWIKDETRNFSKSFKARDAMVSISRFREIGIKEFVMCSTGNTAAAFCYAISRIEYPISAHLFLPKLTLVDFDVPKNMVPLLNLVNAPYHKVIELAKKYSEGSGLPFEGGFSNPARREGSKTLAFEIAEAGLEPDWYIQGVASGTGIYGLAKGYSELEKIGVVESTPRILSVQPDGCAPMVNAFAAGAETLNSNFVVQNPSTTVATLANGDPSTSYPYVRQIILESKGGMEKVSEQETVMASYLLTKFENIIPDLAAGVALAGLIKSVDQGRVERDSTVLLNVSGGVRS